MKQATTSTKMVNPARKPIAVYRFRNEANATIPIRKGERTARNQCVGKY